MTDFEMNAISAGVLTKIITTCGYTFSQPGEVIFNFKACRVPLYIHLFAYCILNGMYIKMENILKFVYILIWKIFTFFFWKTPVALVLEAV